MRDPVGIIRNLLEYYNDINLYDSKEIDIKLPISLSKRFAFIN